MTTLWRTNVLADWFARLHERLNPPPAEQEDIEFFAQFEADTMASRKALAGVDWDNMDVGNWEETNWLDSLVVTLPTGGMLAFSPREGSAHPQPWDDFEAAGADPASTRTAAFQAELLGRMWERQYPGLNPPADRHDKRVLDIQSAIVKVQTYISVHGARPLTDINDELNMMFNDSETAGEWYANPLLAGVWVETRDALATGNAPVTLAEYAANPISATAIKDIGIAPPGDGTLSTPTGNPPTPINPTGPVVGAADLIYQRMSARPSFPDALRDTIPGKRNAKFGEFATKIINSGFTANDARLYDQLYETSVFSEWYNYTVSTPGYISDTSSPQKVREQVQTALTGLTGILNVRQRQELLDMADTLAAMWQDEMAQLPDSDGGDFRLQTSFVDWIKGNVDRFKPELDIAIASDDIVTENAKQSLSPLAQRFLDIGMSPEASTQLADIFKRQPSETFGVYTARLQNLMPQLVAVGQAAYAKDPKKYASWVDLWQDPITGERGSGRVNTGRILKDLAWDIDPMLADIWMTAAEGDGPDAEIARRALTSSDPADTQVALARFGRIKQLNWNAMGGPVSGPVSYEMAGDATLAEVPVEFLNALRAHATQVASVLPQGTREVAVERLMSKAPKYYTGFLEQQRIREAALPEDQRLFGGVPRDEFTNIVEQSEVAKTTQWTDPRLMQQQQQAIAAERGLADIFRGEPEDMVEINGQQRRRQDIVNEIGEEAKVRAQAQQQSILAAPGPREVTDPATGKITTTAYGSLLNFQEKAGAYAAPQPKLAAARARQSSLTAQQYAPAFFQGFGLAARRMPNDAFPDFDLEIGAGLTAGAAPSARFQTSTISPRRRR